jgi:hypothetical protein
VQPEVFADLHQGVAVHGIGGVRRSGVLNAWRARCGGTLASTHCYVKI